MLIPSKPGVYTLVIRLETDVTLRVGGLGIVTLTKGLYTYIGSARGHRSMNLKNRIQRHYSKVKKKHWHIDYLLQDEASMLLAAIYIVTLDDIECNLVHELCHRENFTATVKGFGSSDCSSRCPSHLSKFDKHDLKQLFDEIKLVYQKVGMPPQVFLNS